MATLSGKCCRLGTDTKHHTAGLAITVLTVDRRECRAQFLDGNHEYSWNLCELANGEVGAVPTKHSSLYLTSCRTVLLYDLRFRRQRNPFRRWAVLSKHGGQSYPTAHKGRGPGAILVAGETPSRGAGGTPQHLSTIIYM